MRILFLSSWFPYPTSNGSKLRIYNLLQGLAKYHEITLLSFADSTRADPNVPELQSLCREVQTVTQKAFDPNSWRSRLGFLSLTPRSVVDTYSPEMERQIEQALNTQDFDLIIASQLGMAGYGHCFQGLPALFEEVELAVQYERFQQADSPRSRLRHGLTWGKQRQYVARLLSHFKACTVASEKERQLLSGLHANFQAIEVIPNCVDLAGYTGVRETVQPNSLIFTGSFGYDANYDAMTWFLREVYPRIRAEVPAVSLTITGDHKNLPLPAAANVTLTGFVDNIRPRLASSWLSLAPLRVGGGTRLKILEAMALGTPVISTSKGAEGLAVEHDVHLLIADTPQTYAEAVVRVLREPELRERLAATAYQLVREKYDWPAVMPRFLNLVEQVAQGKPIPAQH